MKKRAIRKFSLSFTKMHGLGNDFMVVDGRRPKKKLTPAIVRRLSERRVAIGFDQALILEGPTRRGLKKGADFRMDIYNADGARVEMCGNGIRCLARYIWSRGLSRKRRLAIETRAGIICPEQAAGGLVKVDMGEPILEGRLIPVRADGVVRGRPLKVKGKTFKLTCVSMGNPHAVTFLRALDKYPVSEYGPLIEKDRFFPKKTNVEFVEVVDRTTIRMRVWERGAGETLACGTGACGAAVAAHINGFTGRRVKVILLGGALDIEWALSGRVYMTGPAEEVFQGAVLI